MGCPPNWPAWSQLSAQPGRARRLRALGRARGGGAELGSLTRWTTAAGLGSTGRPRLVSLRRCSSALHWALTEAKLQNLPEAGGTLGQGHLCQHPTPTMGKYKNQHLWNISRPHGARPTSLI